MYSCGPIHTDEQRLEDQLELIHSSSVPIQDVAWKTTWEQWTIETGGERESEVSVLAVQHNDDDLSAMIFFVLKRIITIWCNSEI